MSETPRIKVIGCSDAAFFFFVFLLIVLFAGEPDLVDALIANLMPRPVPTVMVPR